MTTATITSKGQITIPANVRQSLNVDAGDRVEFVPVESGQYLFVAANRSVTESVRGNRPRKGRLKFPSPSFPAHASLMRREHHRGTSSIQGMSTGAAASTLNPMLTRTQQPWSIT